MDPIDPMRHPEEEREEHLRGQAEESIESGWKRTQEGIRSMKEQASESLEAARLRLSENARSTLAQQKERSVGGMRRLSSAIHEAASKLDQEGDHTLAEYTDLLGTQVDKAANYLQSRDPSTVLHDLEGAARRQAGLLIGGMFVAGLIVARLIRSSQASSERNTSALAPQNLTPSSTEPLKEPTSTPPVSPAPSRFGDQGFGPME